MACRALSQRRGSMARSKPRKQRRGGGPSEAARLRQQTAEALARGAFQKARDLAKTLCRLMPSPEHQQWLVEATVSRAAQLRRAGQPAEAVTVLRTVREEPGDFQPLLARYARELLLVGDWQTAAQIAGRVAGAPLRQQVDTARIDAAMLQGEPGLVHLPAALRPLAQHLLHGLAALSQRESEAVAVTDLSTATPLHDWQILVQGLQAFYTEAPAALRFWQPLAPERVPAAIAAPFRAQIDREFWLQQPQTRQEAFAV